MFGSCVEYYTLSIQMCVVACYVVWIVCGVLHIEHTNVCCSTMLLGSCVEFYTLSMQMCVVACYVVWIVWGVLHIDHTNVCCSTMLFGSCVEFYVSIQMCVVACYVGCIVCGVLREHSNVCCSMIHVCWDSNGTVGGNIQSWTNMLHLLAWPISTQEANTNLCQGMPRHRVFYFNAWLPTIGQHYFMTKSCLIM
jgi:hypothetical protein